MVVTAPAAWMNPIDGKEAVRNADDLQGRIAITERGGTTFIAKARAAQVPFRRAYSNLFLSSSGIYAAVYLFQIAGALAVVIIDNGKCSKYDQLCVPGADKAQGQRFAALDLPGAW